MNLDAPTSESRDWSADLTTQSGFVFHVRPTSPDDEAAIVEFFSHVTPEDLRFRFLTAIPKIDRSRVEMLTHVDHRLTEDFLAFEPGGAHVIASAMMAADPEMTRAEVAISIREDYKNRGISWCLLDHVARYAESKGIRTIESIESRENRSAIRLEREMGFTARECPGDSTLIILEKSLGVPA